MIDEVFDHCPGVGEKRAEELKQLGFRTWGDCVLHEKDLPMKGNRRDKFMETIHDSIDALERDDIAWLASSFSKKHHWRLLARYYHRAAYFDIETTGLSSYTDRVTVVAALEGADLRVFVEGDRLDDFIEYADSRELLVSFNGNCFDVPFLERFFHIPGFTVPHIDLRWVAWHAGYKGGLKAIERTLGIMRPSDLEDIDGIEALNLYYRWQAGDEACRETLIRYCSADVIASRMVTETILTRLGSLEPVPLWGNFSLLR